MASAIPTILKGDESGEIVLALDNTHTYAGATLVVAYQGITKTFTNLVAGGEVRLAFSHDETAAFALGCYPFLAQLVGPSGGVETLSNAEWRVKVTDCLGEVNNHGSFLVKPGSVDVPVTDLGDLPARSTVPDIIGKLNEVVRTLAQRTALALAVTASAFSAFGAQDLPVSKAAFGTLYPDDAVVTDVDASAFAQRTNTYTKAETDEAIEDAIVHAGSVTPKVATNIAESVAGALVAPKADKTEVPSLEADPNVSAWAKQPTKPSYTPSEVGALPDNREQLEANDNFKEAVEAVSPPVVLPSKWALGDVTNAQGGAVSAADVHALPDTYTPPAAPVSSVNGKTGEVSLSATDVGAATPGQVQTVGVKADAADTKAESALAANTETRAIVTTWEGVIDGSNVVIVVTNYISGAYTLADGKFKIRELRDGVYREIYDSRKEILLHLADFETNKLNVTKAQLRAEIASVLEEMQHDAWGRRTSTGNPAPSNTIYTTEPSFVFGGGLEYERIAVGAGAIGILADKGAPSFTAGDSGTFLFKDATGENYFGYSMTSGYALGVRTDAIRVDGQRVTLDYNIVGSCPIVMWCPALFPGCAADITAAGWYQLNDEEGNPIEGAPFECAVDMESTPEVATVYIDTGANPTGFFSAWTSVPGKSSFKTNMPVDIDAAHGGGIVASDGQTILVPQPDGSWRPTNANQ